MKSKIAEAINLRYNPVAILFSNEKPEGLQFKEGLWGCVVAMLKAAAKGRTAVLTENLRLYRRRNRSRLW